MLSSLKRIKGKYFLYLKRKGTRQWMCGKKKKTSPKIWCYWWEIQGGTFKTKGGGFHYLVWGSLSENPGAARSLEKSGANLCKSSAVLLINGVVRVQLLCLHTQLWVSGVLFSGFQWYCPLKTTAVFNSKRRLPSTWRRYLVTNWICHLWALEIPGSFPALRI